jgi:hypothetical protein
MVDDVARYKEMVVAPALESLKNILIRRNLNKEQIQSLLEEKERLWTTDEALVVSRLHVTVTTRCTLNCIHCNDLMPLYKEHYDADPNEIIEDIKIILDSLDELVRLEFVGGEPFLYKPLASVIKAFVEHPKVTQVEMVTNGTIVPKDNLLLDVLKHPKVFVCISDYGDVAGMAKLIDEFERNGVAFCIYANLQWVKGTIPENVDRTNDELIHQYNSCSSAKYCKTLFKRHIYPCSRAAHLTDLGYITSEHLKVHRYESFRNELKEFFTGVHTTACRYCYSGLSNGTKLIPAEQKDGKLQRSKHMLVSREEYTELREWLAELQEGKDWLEQQYYYYKGEYEAKVKEERGLRKWLKKLR